MQTAIRSNPNWVAFCSSCSFVLATVGLNILLNSITTSIVRAYYYFFGKLTIHTGVSSWCFNDAVSAAENYIW